MDFFGKLSDKIVSASKEVSDRAKDVSDSTKLQYDIHIKKQKVSDLYKALGKKYYKENMDSSDEDITEIRDTLAEIADMEKKYADLRGGRRCQKCGAVVPIGSGYCNKCGAKLNESIFEDEDDASSSNKKDIDEETSKESELPETEGDDTDELEEEITTED